jgi:hypothetical protein
LDASLMSSVEDQWLAIQAGEERGNPLKRLSDDLSGNRPAAVAPVKVGHSQSHRVTVSHTLLFSESPHRMSQCDPPLPLAHLTPRVGAILTLPSPSVHLRMTNFKLPMPRAVEITTAGRS